jgi:hypothetical protein
MQSVHFLYITNVTYKWAWQASFSWSQTFSFNKKIVLLMTETFRFTQILQLPKNKSEHSIPYE